MVIVNHNSRISAEFFATVEQQLSKLGAVGLNLADSHKVHRFSWDAKHPTDKAGWCSLFNGFAVYGDWKGRIQKGVISPKQGTLSKAEAQQIHKAFEEAMKEQQRLYDAKAAEAEAYFASLPYADDSFPYLRRKQILPHGVRFDKADNAIVLPCCNSKSQIRSLQKISEDGTKIFMKDGQTSQCFWWIEGESSKRVYLCEGFATGASIAEATGAFVFVGFNCANMAKIIPIIRSKISSDTELVVVCDNDKIREGHFHGASYEAAYEGSKSLSGIKIIIIPRTEWNDFSGYDANDFARKHGLPALKKILEEDAE